MANPYKWISAHRNSIKKFMWGAGIVILVIVVYKWINYRITP